MSYLKGKNSGITFSVPLEKKVLDELSILKEEAVEIITDDMGTALKNRVAVMVKAGA